MKHKEPIVRHIFTADPSAHVFDDRIYIYPSHDIPHDGEDDDEGGEYLMEDYHVLSMDAPDRDCTDHGEALHIRDVPWASRQMWAPDCVRRDGRYYLYFPAKDRDGIFRVGVAVSVPSLLSVTFTVIVFGVVSYEIPVTPPSVSVIVNS